jgi:hypothetical protein
MSILKRLSSWWKVGKARSNSHDRTSVASSRDNFKEPTHFYKVTAVIQQCRYREGYRETMYKCAQECNAYYAKEGRSSSIYYVENSQDLRISLLFPSYGNAKQFQNILINLNTNHALYKRKIDFESRINEETNFRGFQLPEPVSFEDYKFDENNDSMPFLSVIDISDGDVSKIGSDNATSSFGRLPSFGNVNDLNTGTFGLDNIDDMGLGSYDDSHLSVQIHVNPSDIAPMKSKSRSTSPAVVRPRLYRDDSQQSRDSSPRPVSRGSSIKSDSSNSPTKAVIRTDSDPSRALQSVETLPTSLKLKCYCCYFIPKSSDDYLDDPDNAVYGTWLFRQYFDGQIKDDGIPEIAIKFLNAGDETEVFIGNSAEKRTKIEVSIEFRDSSMAQGISRQFKEGTVKVNDLCYKSFMFARNHENMKSFINHRYDETISLWEKDRKEHVVEMPVYSGYTDDDYSFSQSNWD